MDTRPERLQASGDYIPVFEDPNGKIKLEDRMVTHETPHKKLPDLINAMTEYLGSNGPGIW